MTGKMLGHTQAQTTQRYAHLSADPMKRAVDTVSSDIAAAMNGGAARVTRINESEVWSVASEPRSNRSFIC